MAFKFNHLGLRFAINFLVDLRCERAVLRLRREGLRSERANLGLESADLGLCRDELRSEKTELIPWRGHFRFEIADLRSESAGAKER